MRWDRTAWVSAVFYAAAVAVVASLTLVNTAGTWRFELGRASDVAGEYLFICAPILCGLVALNARRVVIVSRGFEVGSKNPKAGAYRLWLKFAVVALLVHLVVMSSAITVAWRSDAASTVSVQPLIRHVGLIVFAAAAGALLGAWIRSIALPAVVFVMGVLIALLVPQTHLRPFLLAGSGTFDFTFQEYPLSLIVLSVTLASAVVLLAWWSPTLPRVALAGIRTLGGIVGVLSLVLMMNNETYALQWVQRTPSCVEQTPRVCAPSQLVEVNTEVADISAQIYNQASPAVARELPAKLELVAPGAPGQTFGSVEFETSERGDFDRLFYETARSLAGANLCIENLPTDKIESQSVASAVVIGWFEKNAGLDIQGSYPHDKERRLLSLSVPQQRDTVARLIQEIRTCHGVDLGALE